MLSHLLHLKSISQVRNLPVELGNAKDNERDCVAYVSLEEPLGPHLAPREDALELGELVLAFLHSQVHQGLHEGLGFLHQCHEIMSDSSQGFIEKLTARRRRQGAPRRMLRGVRRAEKSDDKRSPVYRQ